MSRVRKSVFVLAAFVVADCSPSENHQRQASAAFESVRAFEGAKPESVEVDEITDAAVINGIHQQIVSASYMCSSVQSLWVVKFTVKAGASMFKATCGEGTQYQVTLFDNKGFVKPWTGVLLGSEN